MAGGRRYSRIKNREEGSVCFSVAIVMSEHSRWWRESIGTLSQLVVFVCVSVYVLYSTINRMAHGGTITVRKYV